MTRSARTGSTIGVAVAALVVLGADVALPPVTTVDPARVAQWWTETGPVLAAAGLLRLLGLAFLARIVLATVLVVGARATRRPRWTRAALAVAPRLWRPVLQPLLGVAVIGLGLVGPVPSSGAESATPDPPGTVPVVMRVMAPGPAAPAPTLRLLGPAPTLDTVAADNPAPVPPSVTPYVPPPTTATHVVQPGDSLWSIAARAWADHRGTGTSDPAFLAYWRDCIAANADRLVRPGDPGFLLPGQELVVPPVAGR